MADVTGGDLFVLWRVAQVHLPRVADVFYDANRLLGGNGSGSTGRAFRANEAAYPGSGFMTSSVGSAWSELCLEMQLMMEQIGTTILDTGDGVMAAAHAFEEVDRGNADLLNDYLRDPAEHDPDDPVVNPPSPWAADYPGTPWGS
ncbi:hypothetical protein [Actinoplanes sp. L3-i22]|uniref:hypothetical protein n=1 Tax=Actinoplanes sp. L3-i22 TaxID=2836373 RepID=UPI001C76E02D|nr:hypothetical protein [Actinoplanes sp. L3-i22]BCY14180.1 hypothetical protein L3i22_092680 [Actinoplanes sp. L3-i22]